MMKGSDEGVDAGLAIRAAHTFFIILAAEMNYLRPGARQMRKRREHRAIDSARALASAHHQKCLRLWIYPKRASSRAFLNAPGQRCPHRSSRQFATHTRKMRGAFFEAE